MNPRHAIKSRTRNLTCALLTAAAYGVLCVSVVPAGTVSSTFSFQKSDLRQDGVLYGSEASYGGVVDGVINDNNTTAILSSAATNTLGTSFQSTPAGNNGRQYCGLFAYDLSELSSFIAANTGPNSSVAIQSVSFKLLSAGGQSGSAAIGLYGTDPFTASATWSNYNTTTTANAWTVPYQNLGAPTNAAQFGYTGGGSALTASLGGANPNTGIGSGTNLTWTSSANFISAITNALNRTDKTLYLTANSSFGNSDHRLNFNGSATPIADNRPELLINLLITSTAAPATWTGASDTSWATAGNWSPSGIPAPDAPIIFNNISTANLNTVLNQDFAIASLSVSNPAGAVAISGGNSLTVGALGIDLSAATQNLTISAPVVLGVAQTWSVTNTHTLSVNGGISGSVALTIAGGGKVSLGGVATHTGDTIISGGGTLQMGANNVLPFGAGVSNVVVNGALSLNGTAQAINGLSGNGVVDNAAVGPATLTVSNVASSFSGTIQNTGGALGLVKAGSGGLTLSGANNTFSGGLTVNGGSINPSGGANAIGTGTLTVNSGIFYPVASLTFTNPVTLNGGRLEVGGGNNNVARYTGPVTVTASSTLYADGSAYGNTFTNGTFDMGSGNFTLTLDGAGTATTFLSPVSGVNETILVTKTICYLQASNTFAGTVQPAGANVNVSDAYALQNATLNLATGDTGTVNLNNLNAIIGALTGTRNLALGSGTVSLGNNSASTTYSGGLSGSGSLTKVGSGTLTLSGANTYSGNTTVNGGTLILQQPAFGFSSTVTVTNGAVLELDSATTNSVTALVLNGVSQPNGVYHSGNSGGRIAGTGAIQVGSTPIVWTGALSSEWSVNLLSSPQNWTASGGPVDYSDGRGVLFDDTLTANSTVDISVANVTPFSVTFNNTNIDYTLQGSFGIVGTGSLTKSGPGTVTLLSGNAFTGPMAINGGKLTIGGAGKLGNGTYAGAISNASGATLEYSSTAAQTLSGAITGGGALIANSTNATTLTLSSTGNTYSGLTTISGGMRVAAGPTTISSNTTFNIVGNSTGGGQLFLNAGGTVSNNMTISGVGFQDNSINYGAVRTASGTILSGVITLGGDARIAGHAGVGGTVSGRITGSGGYGIDFLNGNAANSTTGTFILTNTGAANDYNGYTSISCLDFAGGSYTNSKTILKLGANHQIPNGVGAGLLVFNGADANHVSIFELGGLNETVNGLTNVSAGGAIIRNTSTGASVLTIGDADTTSAFSGVITDGGLGKTLALTKIGTGTLTLAGANAYTGNTTINAGTLALSGVGSVAGSSNIIVAGGATFDVSAQSPSFVLNGRTLANSSLGAVFNGTSDCTAGKLSLVDDGINSSFILTNGTMTLSAGTVITVNNTGAPLGNGSHTLIAAATAGSVGLVTGTLPAVTVTGSGTTGTPALQINGTGGLDLVITGANPPRPKITTATISGGNLILQGTNGTPSGTYAILTSTNVALPLANWTTNSTGTFTAGGTFSNAIPVTAEPKRFFDIKQP